MEKYLPQFPLNLVVYPEEDLNLHIFEPRYQQLINECLEAETTFGIPAFISNKLPGYGTEMRVTVLHKRYEDGRMDIKTRGLRIFKLLDFENPAPGKLYAGGNVEPRDTTTELGDHLPELTLKLDRLYDLLQIKPEVASDKPLFSFRVAHKIGLSIEQEYELMTIPAESARQQYLIDHLNHVLPVISEMERTKERIKLNGHFKNLDPLNF